MRLRRVEPEQIKQLKYADEVLCAALFNARRGGAKRTLPKIRSAIKSLRGAIRHAEGAFDRHVDQIKQGLPICARAMGCFCVGHASGDLPVNEPCDTNEENYR